MDKFSALTGIPETTKGLVRELRVRWALEELGIPFREVRYPHPETKKDAYLKKQPFGQVPYLESGDLCMFESGAILLHLALKHGKLLPQGESDRAHALQWLFAALSSVEPYFNHSFLVGRDAESTEAMKGRALQMVHDRLKVLSRELGEREHFGPGFSVAEIMMVTVLRVAKTRDILREYGNLARYVERNEARPAFQRALAEHNKLYEVG